MTFVSKSMESNSPTLQGSFGFVRPAQFVEFGIAHIDIVVVHEHHVAAFEDFRCFGVFRFEGDVARVVGHGCLQIVTWVS